MKKEKCETEENIRKLLYFWTYIGLKNRLGQGSLEIFFFLNFLLSCSNMPVGLNIWEKLKKIEMALFSIKCDFDQEINFWFKNYSKIWILKVYFY